MCFVPTFGGTNRAVSARFGLHELLNTYFLNSDSASLAIKMAAARSVAAARA